MSWNEITMRKTVQLLFSAIALMSGACSHDDGTEPPVIPELPAPKGLELWMYDTTAGIAYLRWRKAEDPGVNSYSVYRITKGPDGSEKLRIRSATDTVFVDTVFRDSTRTAQLLEYRVHSIFADGKTSPFSEILNVTAVPPPHWPIHSNAALRELAVEGTVLEPPFKPSLREYSAWIRSDLEQVKVSARAEDSAVRSIALNGDPFDGQKASSEIPLDSDSTSIRVVVRAENGDTNHYTIRVKRKNDGLLLQSLGLAPSGIGLGHIAGRFFFNDTVPWYEDTLEFNPIATQASSDVRINGMAPQTSGTILIKLAQGMNFLDIHVITKDGKINAHYPITVHKRAGFWKWLVSPQSEFSTRVLQTGDGGYIIAGGNGYTQFFLMKTEAKGDTLWKRIHSTPFGEIQTIIQTEDRGFALFGKATSQFTPSYFSVVRTDSAGVLIWNKTYGGNAKQAAFSAKQTPDGGFILAGTSAGPGPGMSQACLMKIGAQGDSLWMKCYRGDKNNWGYGVTLTPDGGFALAGKIDPGLMFLLKTDRDGVAQWSESYLGPYGSYDSWATANDVLSTASGGFVLVGAAFDSKTVYAMVLKTDHLGRKIKSSVFQNWGSVTLNTIRPVPVGGYILGGTGGIFVARLDDDVDILWSKKFPGLQWPRGGNAEPTAEGGFIIAGWGEDFTPANNTDVILIKMDSQGNTQ